MPRDLIVRIRVDMSALRAALENLGNAGIPIGDLGDRVRDHMTIEAPPRSWADPAADPVADLQAWGRIYQQHNPRPPSDWRGWLDAGTTVDQLPHDLDPDNCWRCDAAVAADDLGLCAECRVALVSP